MEKISVARLINQVDLMGVRPCMVLDYFLHHCEHKFLDVVEPKSKAEIELCNLVLRGVFESEYRFNANSPSVTEVSPFLAGLFDNSWYDIVERGEF